jgi:hypothetical protein
VKAGQAEAVTLAVRLSERGPDATGAGNQHEAALGLTHAHLGARVMPYPSVADFA